MNYEAIENSELERFEGQAGIHHIERLLARLGDGREWEDTGEVSEGDPNQSKCACGHAIKWEFHIEKKDKSDKCVVGSTCIEHFAGINPDLYQRLCESRENLKKRIAEEIKKAKELEADSKIQEAKAESDAAYAEFQSLCESQKRTEYSYYGNREIIPATLYWFKRSCLRREPSKIYKSKTGLLNFYKTNAKNIRGCIEQFKSER